MANRKYYVFCDMNCKFESMTKEQIITAITQAVNNGSVGDIDAGFVTTLKEQNAGQGLTFWLGTTAEYNAIPDAQKDENCLYIKTDDTFESDVIETLAEFEKMLNDYIEHEPPIAEIHVDVIAGTSVSCVDANGKAMPLIENNGTTLVYGVYAYGQYTINGELQTTNQKSKKKVIVDVDTRKQYKVELCCVDDNFAENTWEHIIYVCQQGVSPTAWEVGAVKDGFTIVAKMYDKDSNGNKAPLTLAGDSRMFNAMERPMLSVASRAGDSWANTDMRNTTMPEIKNLLDKKIGYEKAPILKNALRSVRKSSTVINPDDIQLETTYDEVFLLSVTETGAAKLDYFNEPYDYFKNGNKALIDTGVDFWTRDGGDGNFYTVTRLEDNGAIKHTEAVATMEYDYIFAFCI